VSMPRIVGLCGLIGAGKDEVAAHLVHEHDYRRLALADPIKEAVLWVYGPLGVEPRHLYGTQLEKSEAILGVRDAAGNARTGRQLVTAMGMAMREQDPRTWIKRALATSVYRTADHYSIGGGYTGRWGICDAKAPDWEAQRWVIADVRWPNELAMVRDLGGVFWQVTRVGGPPAVSTPDAAGHVSEHAWRDFPKDALLMALHGDLDGLRAQADMALAAGGREHEGLRRGEF